MRDLPGIYQHKIRKAAKSLKGALHGQESGMVDIDPVNLFNFRKAKNPFSFGARINGFTDRARSTFVNVASQSSRNASTSANRT